MINRRTVLGLFAAASTAAPSSIAAAIARQPEATAPAALSLTDRTSAFVDELLDAIGEEFPESVSLENFDLLALALFLYEIASRFPDELWFDVMRKQVHVAGMERAYRNV